MRNPKLVPYETIVRATSGEPEAVRGGRAKRKSVLFIWQFSIFGGVGNERKMKKFPKIPAYSGLCGFVGNERNFL